WREHAARMHHANELLEHLLGNGEIGDHAVFHGPNGLDVARNATKHLHGLATDSLNDFFATGAAVVAYGDDRGLVEHNSLASDINQGIGGTEIDRHIAGEVTTKKSEHGRSVMYKLKRNPLARSCHRAQTRGAGIQPTNQTSNDNL